ncbi:MAG: AI-2E family transporter [Myxococcales bacterium]|nr:AI-2E family transporter [Myxococcales bacterium]MCB9578760.1 AI-2E family transporter [Polyangiaceae bacterium]
MTEPDAPPPSIPPFAAADNKVLAPTWFFILFITTLLGLGYVMRPFAADIVATFVLVALFHGTYEKILRWMGGRRWAASATTSLWIVLVVAIPVSIVGYSLVIEALAAFNASRDMLANPGGAVDLFARAKNALGTLGLHLNDEHVNRLTYRAASILSDFALAQATKALNNGVTIIVHFTIVVVMVFYLLVDGQRLKRFVFDLSPLPIEEEELLVQKFQEVSRGILVGNGVGSVLQGVFGGIAMWVVGIPAPILWGAAMTLFAFLPVVGVSLIVIPATVYLMLVGKVTTGILFFLFCMAQALFLENVVKTRLMGTQTRMHDLLVFLSVIGGLAGFGVFGLLYGPLITVSFLTLAELYRRTYRHKVAERILLRSSIMDG